jgi:ubiquinone/menaquinone biosynthesis C-methylase UbiE
MTISAVTATPVSGDNPFQKLADRYARWFDRPRGRRIFTVEMHAIQDLLEGMPRPWLEVGVGTGRFARALGVDEGIDPSPEVLKIAVRQ